MIVPNINAYRLAGTPPYMLMQNTHRTGKRQIRLARLRHSQQGCPRVHHAEKLFGNAVCSINSSMRQYKSVFASVGASRHQDRSRQSLRVPHPEDPHPDCPPAAGWGRSLWARQQKGEPHLESAGQQCVYLLQVMLTVFVKLSCDYVTDKDYAIRHCVRFL